MSPLTLETPVRFLKGVGERREEAFRRINVFTAEDLLYHIPHRYLDATNIVPVARASVGASVTCVGTITRTGVLKARSGLRIFHALLKDDSGHLECAWPGQPFLQRTIREGVRLLVSGTVRHFHGRQLTPTEFLILTDDDSDGTEFGRMLPIYPATSGLTHKQIRTLTHRHLDSLLQLIDDPIPSAWHPGLPELRDALSTLHNPESLDEVERSRRRLAFDEVLHHQLVFARARDLAKRRRTGIAFELKRTYTTRLKESLPFELTRDQRKAVREISADLTSPMRMHRLLMGDVGSGKTVVALFAMLLAVENGYQAALMAPTELLAEQHAATLARFLDPLGIRPDLLLGRLGAAEKRATQERIGSGESPIVIGTHALIQDAVAFERLGLVVIDEQHRFGVEQRARLIEKGDAPDVLLLSATPIPRSLALARYGDLDITTLTERPPGRHPVKTSLRTERSRDRVYRFVEDQCAAGRQCYVVYPVIDESEKADLRAATTMAEDLAVQFAALRVGLVHGRLGSDEREATMRNFRDGNVDVLVATTVIEVGIDVSNATVMIIEHAERFGLAQLHQLRGRVGRGSSESYCILFSSGEARERLRAFTETEDGFRIAELDLADRGHGELAGTRQSGAPELRFVRFPEDTDLLERGRTVAREVMQDDPDLSHPDHQRLRERLLRRHGRAVELFRVG